MKLNTDENIQTASEYQIMAIPTLLLFRDGQVAKRIQGAMPKKRLEAEIEPALAGSVAGRATRNEPARLAGGNRNTAAKPISGSPTPSAADRRSSPRCRCRR